MAPFNLSFLYFNWISFILWIFKINHYFLIFFKALIKFSNSQFFLYFYNVLLKFFQLSHLNHPPVQNWLNFKNFFFLMNIMTETRVNYSSHCGKGAPSHRVMFIWCDFCFLIHSESREEWMYNNNNGVRTLVCCTFDPEFYWFFEERDDFMGIII